MTDNTNNIEKLSDRINNLMKKQEGFLKEISQLKEEINQLKARELAERIEDERGKLEEVIPEVASETITIQQAEETKSEPPPPPAPPISEPESISNDLFDTKSGLEKFIGENLINKIGIIITIIGVAIGAKYAIDHHLISPLTRIIIGYLIGGGLLFFAVRLKNKFRNFSAVLLSGSMSIIYFITYAAFSFYNLMPQYAAFIIMVIITIFTVTAAINYNKQLIAHIGLVGAYAVPFLLSNGSDNALILFTYTTIINIGILIIAFRKYWKLLYYTSFGITWLLYLTWYFTNSYDMSDQFGLCLTFLSVFFAIFYMMFLAYKLIQSEKFQISDVIMLLLNSFIFYGTGYDALYANDTGEHLLGAFTLVNAGVHAVVSLIIYQRKLADRNIFLLVSGLVLVFITIAIPVQLNGNWVTLLWVGETVVLFRISRTKKVQLYEYLAFIMMLLAFLSILNDWFTLYYNYDPKSPETWIRPVLNINMLSSVLFIVAFGYINYLNRNRKYSVPAEYNPEFNSYISVVIPSILLISIYASFSLEITSYLNQLEKDSLIEITKYGRKTPVQYCNMDFIYYKNIWLINYSIFYLSLLTFVNIRKIRNKTLGIFNLSANVLVLVFYLTIGLFSLSELRESYLNQGANDLYFRSIFNILARYVSFGFVIMIILSIYHYTYKELVTTNSKGLKIFFDIILFTSIVWILSSELLNLFDIKQLLDSYKLALSILWGIFALFTISIGIWKNKQHLRIWAIILFGFTLLKLFFYDLRHLDTISKTIVFVTLGILLLIISYLYNKYKHIISG